MTSNTKNTIIFYAPTGHLTKDFKNGGAEAGCRKTIEVLIKAGFSLVLVEKPIKKYNTSRGKVLLMLSLLKTWLRITFLMMKHRTAKLHVVGFYLSHAPYEALLIKTATILGIKSIYEIRNGGMIESFTSGGVRYQKTIKRILSKSTGILCQGLEYIDFIKQKFGRDAVYYPNYVMDKFRKIESPDNRNQESKLRIIYLGRVVPDKNIDFILDVCSELKAKKIDFLLQIIGGYEPEYYQFLQNKMTKLELIEGKEVVFHGRLEVDSISPILQKQHFFLFPSKEKREGHSNSLTETMSYGIVPIVSNAGFNADIVNNSELVISIYDTKRYADRIEKIWESKMWKELSTVVKARVEENYTESIVKKSLVNLYSMLAFN